jgi:CheY-like chemotaxis protein
VLFSSDEGKLIESILIIDDSPSILEVNRTVLELSGFEVVTTQTGTEALEILSTIERPSLVLLDMQMEDMSGLSFLTLLTEKNPEILKNVPFVFFTGQEKVPESIAWGTIRKGLGIKDFLKSVHHFIDLGHSTVN